VSYGSDGAVRSEPHDARAEHDLLWLSILDTGRRKLLLQNVRRQDFFLREHAEIFTAIERLDVEGAGAIDTEMVAARLESALAKEVVRTPAANTWYPDDTFERHLTRLRQLSDCRTVQNVALEVAARGLDHATVADPESYLDEAAERISKSLESRESRAEQVSLPQLVEQFGRELIDPSLIKKRVFIKLPLRAFESTIKHLEAGRLYVVAGRPSMGKSALAVQLSYMIAARDRQRVLVYSLEMPPEEVRDRCIAAISGIPLERVIERSFRRDESPALMMAAEKLSQVSGFEIIDAAEMYAEDILRHIRKEHAKRPLQLVLIDYLQLMRLRKESDNREQDVSTMSRSLKLIARSLGIALISVFQLNRDNEKRQNKRPKLSDLRESGAIEQDADAIIFVYREGLYTESVDKSATEVIIAKNRSGPPGTGKLRFAGEITWFRDEVQHGF
jgi:replicative DNA helicase